MSVFATGRRRRKGLEFICIFGHDAYGTVAAVNGGKVYITNNILNLHYAAWGHPCLGSG